MTTSEEIRPFRIDIPQRDLDDLRYRLEHARIAGDLPGVGWTRGVPRDYLRSLIAYWRERYDWRAQERQLNAFPQYLTELDGQDIHFIHLRSPEPTALPLLVTHGYPGSVAEFTRILGPLTDPRAHGGDPADAFHVVAPSLPGYGFSTPLREPGWEVGRTSRAWIELMRRLGYSRYGTHGGDIGSGVSGMVGGLDRDRVVGVHVNSDLAGAAAMAGDMVPVDLSVLTDDERKRLDDLKRPLAEGYGYLKLQSTRPQTVGYALADSPTGQLAWIVEKFKEWTNQTRDLPEDAVDRDQFLTNVSLYWFTASGASSGNFLYEAAHHYEWGAGATNPHQGWAMFGGKDDIIRKLFNPDGTIEHWTEYDEGGHFPAMECPELLVDDLRRFFRPLR
jgi:pimeloyl-ACP methyl ester carboxylesterase